MPELKASPRNRALGLLADALSGAKSAADTVQLPVVGGLGSLLFGDAPELVNDVAYYGPQALVRGGNAATGGLGTFAPDRRVLDAIGVAPMAPGAVRAAKTVANPMTYGRAFMEAQAPAVKSQIFAGPNSKIWSAADADAFKQMEKKGASYSDMAGKTGMSRNVQGLLTKEIDDSGAKVLRMPSENELIDRSTQLKDVLDHPNLYAAYPDLQYMPVGLQSEYSALASYSPKERALNLPSVADDQTQRDRFRGILLHETQHGIQDIEDWPFGANLNQNLTNYLLRESQSREAAPFRDNASKYNMLAYRAQPLYELDTIKSYIDQTKNPNLKPSAVTNDSLWYKYSDDIRQYLGPMPKKPGSERTQWLQDAAAYKLRRYFEDEGIQEWNIPDLMKEAEGFNRRELTKLQREMRPLWDDKRQSLLLDQKYNKLMGMSPKDQYLRSGGEVQARLTDARKDLTPEQRLAIDPMSQLDVPAEDVYGVPFDAVMRRFGGR